MKKNLFDRNFFIVLGLDFLFCLLALFGAYLIRFEFNIPPEFLKALTPAVPAILIVKIGCFFFFGLYRGMWRYTGVTDLLNIVKAVSLGELLVIGYIFLLYRFEGFPRSVFAIDACFTLLAISGCRIGIRLFFQKTPADWHTGAALESIRSPHAVRYRAKARRLLIVGAGNCGEKIYREIKDNPQLHFRVVGFLDDNPSKLGRTLHGVDVVGVVSDLKPIADHLEAEEVLIATPSANAEEMRRIVRICKESGLPFKTVPGYGELIDGKVTVKAIRDVDYRDLIGRATVKLDERVIDQCLRGRCVLVTGAGGSIGAELCRLIRRYGPERIVLYERNETPLYEIEHELKHSNDPAGIFAVLGDIRDESHLHAVFDVHRPQVVFHAAAYKHVPMLEAHPWKAVENNILGTAALVRTAAFFNVERFVLVSTDKAVRPANVMGASKRVAEMIALNHNACRATRTQFMAVRFGNVVGSSGSVVPLFMKQIAAGGPVTVTHPQVTRFFMTIREACRLILQAGAIGQGGEVFVLDMGTPIRIEDMARDLIRLSGFEPDVDIHIKYIGLRPGEKLTEELMADSENMVRTTHPKIYVLKGAACDMSLLNGKISELEAFAEARDPLSIRQKLVEIVPDFRPAMLQAVKPLKLSGPN
jgi:FlaA1/EpsC-like NDP-sugar epimerase